MDDKIRPLINQSRSILVDIDVHLQAIKGLDEKEQLLESTISIACRWNYETLIWNKSEFSDITGINISPKDSWIPELIVSNSVDSLFVLKDNRDNMVKIKVLSNGDATWYTGGNIRTSCHIDITKYPFDTQTCIITISKTEPDSEVLISDSGDKVTTILYKENSEWDLKKSVVKTRVLYGYITFIDINLTLSRHSLFYTLNVVLPVALLGFMTVLCFKIPATSGESLSFSIALLLTFVVLLNLISESMPRVPNRISYLQLYVNYQLTVAVVITTLSIMLVNMSYSDNKANDLYALKLCLWCYSNQKIRKTVIPEVLNEIATDKDTNGMPNIDSQSDTEIDTDSYLDRQSVIRHIGKALFWVFMTMYILSTILFFICVTI
ncbi:neuronal acetylcholine receptor subunit beta-3-like [Mercenaria mercenaria]|uniref:neuronal acetylcholine receptor subunit beta-3-like n=1 Tax=Mercenaria mercenaria TaxID=6596 RepID=UPI00234E4E3B|nr:neuronal acetylcholine receptor subunit beta-3-like [Mercenaria mercenaria]